MGERPDQYPPPQRPPPLPQSPFPAAHRPPIDHRRSGGPLDPVACRRASTFMLGFGVLLLLVGGLMLATPLLPGHELDAKAEELRAQGKDVFPPGTSVADVRRFLIRASLGLGSFLAGLGVIELWLGFLVRQGNRTAAAAVVGLGFVILAGIGALTAGFLVTGNLGGVLVLLIPGIIVAAQCVQLMNALRGARQGTSEAPPEHGSGASATPPPLPVAMQIPPGEPPIFDYNFAASQRLPPPPAAPGR